MTARLAPHNKRSIHPVIVQLRAVRIVRKMSMRRVAMKLEIDDGTLSRWENGIASPSILDVSKWAKTLGYRIPENLGE